MPRTPKPFLTAIYLQEHGWFLAAVVERTKKAAAEHAFEKIEDPQGTTSSALATYTAEVFFDPKVKRLWMKPTAWTGARELATSLLPKKFRDLVQERDMPELDGTGVRMPTKKADLTFFRPLED
jgi:hypothetical protein